MRRRIKVVQIATSLVGGAGVAAFRLNQALNDANIDSTLISNKVDQNLRNPKVLNNDKSRIKSLNSSATTILQKKIVQSGNDLITLYSISTLNIDEIFLHKPDIIHLHSFYNLLSTDDLKKILSFKIPVFVTLHDERVLTGGCHCTNGCGNFETNCEKCPQVKSLFHYSVTKEREKWRALFNNVNIVTFICPSNWMARQVAKARIDDRIEIAVMRNPISSAYLDLDLHRNRTDVNSPFIVTFVSQNIYNSYKGLKNVLDCISIFSNEISKNNIFFRFVGEGPKLEINGVKFSQHPNLSEKDLIDIYKSSDLLLVPSKSDNSPNIIFEAAMCGVPFLGSDRTGLPELSEIFGRNFFEYGSPESLFTALIIAKNTIVDRSKIRNIALENTDPQIISKKLFDLYQRKLTEASLIRSDNKF